MHPTCRRCGAIAGENFSGSVTGGAKAPRNEPSLFFRLFPNVLRIARCLERLAWVTRSRRAWWFVRLSGGNAELIPLRLMSDTGSPWNLADTSGGELRVTTTKSRSNCGERLFDAGAVDRDQGTGGESKCRGRSQDLRMHASDQRTRLRKRALSDQRIRDRAHTVLVGGKGRVERDAGRFVECFGRAVLGDACLDLIVGEPP